LGKKDELKNFDISDKLIAMQPKIKPKAPHNSYVAALLPLVKK
jgi:hypothetical protein